jgi:type VI secretion system secreted protein VgrG
MPKLVRVRAYNHRYPEGAPDGFGHVPDGHLGRVYEYGGIVKNCHEAEYRATLYARRLWVENSRVDGKGNCASFRAGLCVPIMVHNDNQSISGKYLLVSVKHTGGWERGAYTYRNEFSCVRSEKEVFAPPLRTPIPRIDGVTTAPVGATGDLIPTLNEYGDYNVNMPFALDEDREKSTVDGLGDYGRSKDIRLAQPSGGMSDNGLYGIHFPSKRGAEMVLAYVDGNPDRPLGLGFVPNAAALSVVRNSNRSENVIRTWGGNELVMDDTRNNKSVKLSSAGERYLELHDGDELVRVKSENCEMLFSDADKYALINAGGHIIHINYDENNPQISIKTINEHEFNLSDKDKTISVKTTDGCEMIMNDKNGSISISNASHSVTGDLLLESRGDIRIKAAGEVAISGAAVRVSSEEKEVEVKAKTFLNVSAENITQQANENMEIQGQKIDIHGSANLYMESNNTTVLGKAKVVVESDSQAKIESGGVLVVKSKAKTAVEGGLVTVN